MEEQQQEERPSRSTRTFSVSMPWDVVEELDEIARNQRRSRSNLLTFIAEKYIQEQKDSSPTPPEETME